jgi:hypothetical protein
MRLKISKVFRPCAVEKEDELFPNGLFVFNVTKLALHLTSNQDDFPVEQVAVSSLGLTSSNLDENTVRNADLSRPLLLAEIAPSGFNVIDGNHRVARARLDGIAMLPAQRVGPKVHQRFLTSVESYQEYVRYWNAKVRDQERRDRMYPKTLDSVNKIETVDPK